MLAAKAAFDAKTEEERTAGTDQYIFSRKYSALVAEWVKVHFEIATEALAPIVEKAELVALLDAWETNPDRSRLVKEADERLAEGERLQWLKTYSGQPVFQQLVDGVKDVEGESPKLAKLLDNFRLHGPAVFDYTMQMLNPAGFLRGGKTGDCNTLTHTFREIATKYLGIPVTIVSSGNVGFPGEFLTPTHTTIDGKTGNVGGKYWAFVNHFWISHAGVDYDVLFGEKGKVDTSKWVRHTGTEGGMDLFGAEPALYKVKATDQDVVEKRYVLVSGPGS